MNTMTETQVRLFASSKSWIEGEAVRQLYAIAKLEGVRLAVGFPDLHPGRGTPVGCAFVTEDVLYPHVIGGDIGCGMALFKTNLLRREVKLDRWTQLRFNLERPWDEFVADFLAEHDLESTEFDTALGTIGGGNHFAELQVVEQIFDAGEFKRVGVGKEQLVLLVHSGSRGLGESVLRDYVVEHHGNGVAGESPAAQQYLRGHDLAVRWARANRSLIARRFAATLGAEVERVWDGCHNSITARESDGENGWVHRKGAVEAGGHPIVIPGSRGSLSYLVKPLGDGESRAWSLAHGAGRKWARSETRLRMRERFNVMELVQTPLGGRVICEERDLLYEEAPAAYKNIEAVIQDLVDAELVSVIATFRPLLTYKTRKL
ncbi:MAG TPA: RNA ligase RtcB family protein [Verrucomicrobiae bacterium]|jgi:release factor H-coupled RctB family protein|nr:RNA ligase RtcB family protein [Verrucomicrobiae bacterium]